MHHGNRANYSCEIRVGCLNKRSSLFSGASFDGLWLEEPSIRKEDLPYASEHLNAMSGNLCYTISQGDYRRTDRLSEELKSSVLTIYNITQIYTPIHENVFLTYRVSDILI